MNNLSGLLEYLHSWETKGKHVIDCDIVFFEDFPFPNEGIVFGDGSEVTFVGGRIINETGDTILVQGDNITLIAGPEEIFVGDFDFRRQGKLVDNPNFGVNPDEPQKIWEPSEEPAQWTMERAYPQWFGAQNCADLLLSAHAYFSAGGPDNITLGNSKIDEIADSSDAINAAIQLKRTGEVFIPQGFYKICNYIHILPGIKLVGEGTQCEGYEKYGTVIFPWRTPQPEQINQFLLKQDVRPDNSLVFPATTIQNVKLSCIHFPKHPKDTDWRNQDGYAIGKEYGYMILAGLSDKCSLTYRENERYPSAITYYKSDKGQINVPGIEIRNLTLKRIEYDDAPDYRLMRGILMHATIKLDGVRMYGLSQFCCCTTGSNDYDDMRMVERCSFTPPSFSNLENLNTLYHDKIYAIDLSGSGDALNVIGNHAATYCDKIGALHLKSCNGGAITGNILNSDVLIERCQGIDFAGNHMEYGSRLTIASSGVAVRGNFIWRGEKAAITIRRFDSSGYLYYHCSVTLDNNQFFWRTQHYVNGQLDPPQAAHSLYPYDVVTDGYASIAINNTFRQCRRNLYDESSYFGILMGWLEMRGYSNGGNDLDEEQAYTYEGDDPRNIVGTDNARISDFEEFNRVSHIASIGSKVVGKRVTPMPSTIDKLAFDYQRNTSSEMCMRIGSRNVTYEEKDGWKIQADVNASAYQDYQVWLFADYRRRLLMKGPVSLSSYYYTAAGKGQRRITDAKQNLWIAIGQGNITNWNVPAGPYWAYIERQSYTEQTMQGSGQQVEYVRNTLSMHKNILPMSDATMLWDDGLILSGFDWKPMVGADDFTALEVNDNVERVQYHGENVECLFSTAQISNGEPPQLAGEWLDGDVIKWVANGAMVVYEKVSGVWVSR